MCNPALLALAGAAVSGIGAMQSANSKAKGLEARANEARIQEVQTYISDAFTQRRTSRAAKKVGGQQRAAQTDNGLALTGSFVDVQNTSAQEADLDIQSIRFQSQNDRRSLGVSADNFNREAGDTRRAGVLSFLSSVMGGAVKYGQAQ